MDDIGYELNDKDIEKVVHWLEINDPENANPEVAKKMLIEMKEMYRDMGKVDEDLLHKALEKYKNKSS